MPQAGDAPSLLLDASEPAESQGAGRYILELELGEGKLLCGSFDELVPRRSQRAQIAKIRVIVVKPGRREDRLLKGEARISVNDLFEHPGSFGFMSKANRGFGCRNNVRTHCAISCARFPIVAFEGHFVFIGVVIDENVDSCDGIPGLARIVSAYDRGALRIDCA